MKNAIGNLIRIALNLWFSFGNIVIFTILILPAQEHEISLHLFMSSLISFISVLKFSYRECIQFFTIENNVCCRLIIYGLYYIEVGFSYAHFLKSFNHKWVLNFVKGFSVSIEIIIWFLSFNINMVYHIDLFVYIEESLHIWNKPNLVMVYELFDVLLNSVC